MSSKPNENAPLWIGENAVDGEADDPAEGLCVEQPKAAASQERSADTPGTRQAVASMDAAESVRGDGEALRGLLTRVAEQARLKKLDGAPLTAARELSNAVDPHRDWS